MLWGTRCIICDTPGAVLCTACRMNLPFIDQWQACPRCGAPFGRLTCTECNSLILSSLGRRETPFDRCVSAIEHAGSARRIVTGYKDAGERRLGTVMARIIADSIPPSWASDDAVLTFIPASAKARRARGFDHGEEMAVAAARSLGISCTPLFERPTGKDQRALSRIERFQNMSGRISVRSPFELPASRRIILIDDVYTTGATLFAASDALRDAGAGTIFCATFSRVW